jgi:four helix bundle protein
MHNFKELKIWNRSMDMVVEVYKATAKFPNEEKYGITAQIRKSAVSVPSNIAEGAGKNSDRDFVRFLSIAQGSSYELQTQLILSQRLGFMEKESCNALVNDISEIQKMNYRFQESLGGNVMSKN